jgi:hypothetical protein
MMTRTVGDAVGGVQRGRRVAHLCPVGRRQGVQGEWRTTTLPLSAQEPTGSAGSGQSPANCGLWGGPKGPDRKPLSE